MVLDNGDPDPNSNLAYRYYPCGINGEGTGSNNNIIDDEPFYGDKSNWIPDGSTPLKDTPRKTLKLAFHIFQSEDPNNPNHWEDTPEDRAILLDILTRTNRKYDGSLFWAAAQDLSNPSDPILAPEDELPEFDTRITFSLGEEGEERIFFYQNNEAHTAASIEDILGQTVITNNPNFNMSGYVNVYWVAGIWQDNNPNVGGAAPSASYSNLEYLPEIVIFRGIEGAHGKAHLLAHELGHILGLRHTYNGANDVGEAICDENDFEYLSDVYASPSDCAHLADWNHPNIDIPDDRYTNNLMGGYKSNNYISPMQAGIMQRALAFTNARYFVEDCPYNSSRPHEITNSEVWDFDIRMYQDIVVKSGATLSIECGVRMPHQSKIIVERGAKLIVDGGLITNICDGKRWQGIEVHGKSNIAHNTLFGTNNVENLTVADYENLNLDANGPGVVILKNDAIIENAGSSITTKKRESGGDSNYYGGIVYAENSTFTNNRRAVEFMRYAHQNYSQFRNCSFTSDEELPKPYVSMWDTHGITFDACDFVGTGGGSDYGIYSVDAGYNLPKNNSFTDFTIGISATNGGTLTDLNIGQAEATNYNANTANQFSNCVIGVYVAGADDAEIVGNDFSQNTVGLYNESSKETKAKFNHFSETTTANANTGIVYMQTDNDESEIFQNTFTNIYNSIYASQNNLGLKIKCNENINSAYNLVINGTEAVDGSIHPQQGIYISNDPNAPASNKFSTYFNPNTHIHTQGNTAIFSYLHHRNLDYIPIYDAGANYTKTEHDTDFNELCFPNDVSDECPNPPCEEYLFDLKTEIDNLKNIRATHEESSFAYKALTEDISYLEYKLAVALKGSVKEYEKSGNIDEAINLLEQSDREQAAWQKVRLQIKYGRYDKAAEVLSLLPQDELKKQQFVQLQELQLRLRTSNRSYAELTNGETTALEDIASSQTTQAIYARNILNFIDENYGQAAMPIIIPSTGKWHSSKASLTISNMNLVPNPAKEQVFVTYNGMEQASDLKAVIYSIDGAIVKIQDLHHGNALINTETLEAGIYLCAIQNADAMVLSQNKLVIIK